MQNKKYILKLLIVFALLFPCNTAIADTSNIGISKTISGLQYYMYNDSLIVEWDEVGYVNIQVIDTASLEILYSSKTDINWFSIAVNTDELLVSITPVRSSETTQFLVQTYNIQNVNVYPEKEIVNSNSFTLKLETDNSYYVSVYDNNNDLIYSSEFLEPGEHILDIPLNEEGQNQLYVYLMRDNGYIRTYETNVIKDTKAPKLSILTDIDAIETKDSYITISGNVAGHNKLYINDSEIDVEDNGNFEFNYFLFEGTNTISVKAYDEAGNESYYDAVVKRVVDRPVENRDRSPILIVLMVLLVIITVLFVVKRVHNGHSLDKEKLLHAKQDDSPQGDKNPPQTKAKMRDKIRTLIFILFPVLILVTIYYAFIYVGVVGSASMEPTIKTGDIIVSNKLAYVLKKPDRGDVVVFYSDEEKTTLVKRVIGIEGDVVEFIDGELIINGKICKEDYLERDIETNADFVFSVPPNTVFVLGDNRENSLDSRYWQEPYISVKKIYGKVFWNF